MRLAEVWVTRVVCVLLANQICCKVLVVALKENRIKELSN